MSDLNAVSLVGRITNDPEEKVNTNGNSWLTFNLANNHYYKHNGESVDEASFFRVKVWSRLAKPIQKYLVKGKQIGINGRLCQYRFKTKDEKNINIVEVVASQIQLLSDSRKSKKDTKVDDNITETEMTDDVPF